LVLYFCIIVVNCQQANIIMGVCTLNSDTRLCRQWWNLRTRTVIGLVIRKIILR